MVILTCTVCRYYPYWKTGDIPMLVGFIVADHAKQMEGLTDKEVTESAMKQLRAIFHNTIIPEPTESIFTRWYQNEYSFGSYSVPGVGIHGRARKHLSAPLSCFSYDNNRVEECLFFAGEATNVNYPGTTHGKEYAFLFEVFVSIKFHCLTIYLCIFILPLLHILFRRCVTKRAKGRT